MQNKKESILYIQNKFPNAFCELNHSNELELLIATLLSAQTTDKAVNKLTFSLFKKYKNVYDYANAEENELVKDINTIGLSKTKASNIIKLSSIIINEFDGLVPSKKEDLLKLPGVGNKTANVFLSVIYNEPLMAVDTHVERVSKRLYFAKETDTPLQVEEKIYKLVNKSDIPRFHHQMIFFGRYHCTAKNPKCDECLITSNCRYYKVRIKDAKKN